VESATLDMIELLIFVIFALEALAKMLCHPLQPWLYFCDREDSVWNCFDFTLVLLSTPGLGFGT
jgi:hypothetical protein